MKLLSIYTLNFWLLGGSLLVWGQDVDEAMQEAQVFFDAGDYGRARVQYQSLLEGNPEEWQRVLLIYDIGTAYLGEAQWKEALNYYQKLEDDQLNWPLLELRWKTNAALAQLMSVKSEMQVLQQKEEYHYGDYQEMILLLKKALENISQAEKAGCRLSKAEGSKDPKCTTPADLVDLRLEIKLTMAALIEEFFKAHVLRMSAVEDTATLMVASQDLLQEVHFLQTEVREETLILAYQKLYLAESTSWQPLWEALKNASKSQDVHTKALIAAANAAFSEGIVFLKGRSYQKSGASFKKSAETLREVLDALIKASSLTSALQALLSSYEWALLQDPIQTNALEAIFSIQNLLQGHFSPELPEHAPEHALGDQKNAEIALESALKDLKASQPIQARIWLEIAQDFIKALIMQLPGQKIESRALLQRAIEEQKLALHLSHLRQQAEGHEKLDHEVSRFFVETEKRALLGAEGFLDKVFAEQRQAFEARNNKEAAETRSQNELWEEVLPLVNAGINDGTQALKLLNKEEDVAINLASALQQKVVDKWQEALEKLTAARQKTSPKQKQTPEEQKAAAQQPATSEPQEKQKPKIQPQASGAALIDVIRTLQEMEADDRSSPELKLIPVHKGEERPW